MRSSERHDILDELFRGEQGQAAGAGLDELESLIHACLAPKSPAAQGRRAVLPLKRKGVSSTKKTTHYLREDVFDGLTQAKQILRRLLPEGVKGRASKSGLVNCAVNALLQEIEEKGLESPMIKSILGKKE
jgi:hypothetical protein